MQQKYYKNNNSEYCGIDVMKLVMAICVVAIHTNPFYGFSDKCILSLFNSVTALAVPFFFLTTGWILGNKMSLCQSNGDKVDYLKKYLVKTIKYYLIWSAIYFPLALCQAIKSGSFSGGFILNYIRHLLFIGENYNSWILWYLLAVIYGVIFLIVLIRHLTVNKIALCGLAVLIISFVLDYCSQKEITSSIVSNIMIPFKYTIGNGRVLKGCFYIPFGVWISSINRSHCRKAVDCAFVIAGITVNIIAFYISNIVASLAISYVGTAIGSAGVLLLAVDIKPHFVKHTGKMREISKVVYFIHLYIWTIYYMIVYGQKTYGMASFVFTTAVCILIGLVVSIIKDKYRVRHSFNAD